MSLDIVISDWEIEAFDGLSKKSSHFRAMACYGCTGTGVRQCRLKLIGAVLKAIGAVSTVLIEDVLFSCAMANYD
jgi:hypothetical protein